MIYQKIKLWYNDDYYEVDQEQAIKAIKYIVAKELQDGNDKLDYKSILATYDFLINYADWDAMIEDYKEALEYYFYDDAMDYFKGLEYRGIEDR